MSEESANALQEYLTAALSNGDCYEGMFGPSLRTLVLAVEIYHSNRLRAEVAAPHIRSVCDALLGVNIAHRCSVKGFLRMEGTAAHRIVEMHLFSHDKRTTIHSSGSLACSSDWLDPLTLHMVCQAHAKNNTPLPPRGFVFLSQLPLFCTTPRMLECFPLRKYGQFNNCVAYYGNARADAWLAHSWPLLVVPAFFEWLRSGLSKAGPQSANSSKALGRRQLESGQWIIDAFKEELSSRGFIVE